MQVKIESRRKFVGWVLSAFTLLTVLTLPRSAKAHHISDGFLCFIYSAFWTVPSLIIDTGFGGDAIYEATRNGPPDRGLAIAEVGFMSAKLIISLGTGGYYAHQLAHDSQDQDSRCMAIGALVTTISSAGLLGQGIWALTQPLEVVSASSTLSVTHGGGLSPSPSGNRFMMAGLALSRRF